MLSHCFFLHSILLPALLFIVIWINWRNFLEAVWECDTKYFTVYDTSFTFVLNRVQVQKKYLYDMFWFDHKNQNKSRKNNFVSNNHEIYVCACVYICAYAMRIWMYNSRIFIYRILYNLCSNLIYQSILKLMFFQNLYLKKLLWLL